MSAKVVTARFSERELTIIEAQRARLQAEQPYRRVSVSDVIRLAVNSVATESKIEVAHVDPAA